MNSPYTLEWELTRDFYDSLEDSRIDEDIARAQQMVHDLADTYRGRLGELTPAQWLEFFAADDRISTMLYKVQLYLMFLGTLDTQNQDVIKKQGSVEPMLIDMANQTAFVEDELRTMGERRLTELSREPELAPYSHYFVSAQRSARYSLPENIEQILNHKSPSGVGAMIGLYDEYVNSFMYSLRVRGEEKELTEEQVRALRMDEDEEVRKAASSVLAERYGSRENQIILTNIYRAVLKNAMSEVKVRGYESTLAIRNESEEMDNEVVQLLVDRVMARREIFQRFLRAKARLLSGKNTLDEWNIFAPVGESEGEYTYPRAMDLILDTFSRYDPEMTEYIRKLATTGYVSVMPARGKRGGAYCAYYPHFESRVHLNFTGKETDVLTMAYELGHAFHGHKGQIQPSQMQHESLCLAETASTFNETVMQRILLKSKDGDDRIAFLDNTLLEITGTVFRQIQYLQFELQAHSIIAGGGDFSYTDLNRLWRETKTAMAGDTIAYTLVQADHDAGWSAIPHIFHTPFYVYAYAFGLLLANNLYALSREAEDTFLSTYHSILSAAGSKRPKDILLDAGLDITKEKFYDTALDMIEELVSEYETAIAAR